MLKLKIDSLVGWRFSDVVQASLGWSQWTSSDSAGVSHGLESVIPHGVFWPKHGSSGELSVR